MNFKYLFVLIFILILSVGAVSAQDDILADDSVDNIDNVDVPSGSEYVIDDTNYADYFDDEGKILETANITDGDTIKIGDVNNKTFVIDKSLNITSNSTDNVMADSYISFVNGSNSSYVSGIKIVNSNVTKDAITIEEVDNVTIISNVISLESAEEIEDDGIFAIYAIYADNLMISDNVISYIGKTNGTKGNAAVLVIGSEGVIFDNNTVYAELPSADVDWELGTVYSQGVCFNTCDNLTITENTIAVNVTSVCPGAFYDTAYALKIMACDNLDLIGNEISIIGNASYAYAVSVSGEDIEISDNEIGAVSTSLQANGIDISGTTSGTIEGNTIEASAPGFAYGINNYGDVNVTYTENAINAFADTAYGIETLGNEEYIEGNVIAVVGNKTTGIASKSENVVISENDITVTGENIEGDYECHDSFGAETVGIKVYSPVASIFDNEITSTGSGIIVNDSEADISDNTIEINSTDNADSYGIFVNASVVDINKNNISYIGNSNGSFINKALYLFDSSNSEITNNTFDIEIPAFNLDWTKGGIALSEGISVAESENITILGNDMEVNWNGDSSGDYNTIYAINVNSDNADIIGNNIILTGDQYAYGIQAVGSANVSKNIVEVDSEYYSAGLYFDMAGEYVAVDNTLEVSAPSVAYGITSSAWLDDINGVYEENTVNVEAPLAYGIRVSGNDEVLVGNIIDVEGNYTIGIASNAENLTAISNEIYANGNGEGNVSAFDVDSLKADVAGIKVTNGTATIIDNSVETTGEYAVNITGNESTVHDNYLVSDLLFGDDSVIGGNNETVYNNTPDYDAFLDVEDMEYFYGANATASAVLHTINGTPIENATVTFRIGDAIYNATTDGNGTASIPLDLEPDYYEVEVSYNPGEGYTETTEEFSIDVSSTIESDDLDKMYKNATQYTATFVDSEGNPLANSSVRFNVNGVNYTRKTNESGTAKLNINLLPGEYNITATNLENNESVTNVITVESTIEANNITKYYKNDTQYVATFFDGQGNPLADTLVSFNVNGKTYYRKTNENGTAKMNINLPPGNYSISAKNPVNNQTFYNNIEVLSTIITSDLTKTFGDKTPFVAHIINGSSNSVFESVQPDLSDIADMLSNFNVTNITGFNTTDAFDIISQILNTTADIENIAAKYNVTDFESIISDIKNCTGNLSDLINSIDNSTLISLINESVAKLNATLANLTEALQNVTDASGTQINMTETIAKFANFTEFLSDFEIDDITEINVTKSLEFIMDLFNLTSNITDMLSTFSNTSSELISAILDNINVSSSNLSDNFKSINNETLISLINSIAGDLNITLENLTKGIGSYGDPEAPVANATVTFNINGVLYKRTTNATGDAKLNINLPAGEYVITTTYNDLSVANKITVKA